MTRTTNGPTVETGAYGPVGAARGTKSGAWIVEAQPPFPLTFTWSGTVRVGTAESFCGLYEYIAQSPVSGPDGAPFACGIDYEANGFNSVITELASGSSYIGYSRTGVVLAADTITTVSAMIGATTQEMYQDGKLVLTTSSSLSNVTSMPNLAIMAYQSAVDPSCTTAIAISHKRFLTGGEHLMMAIDPYCFLRRPR